jgi:hypothetical protein
VEVIFLGLHINEAARHEDVWGRGDIAPSFVASALDEDVRFLPRPLFLGERAPGTHRVEGWVDSRASPDTVKKNHSTLPGIEPRPSRP